VLLKAEGVEEAVVQQLHPLLLLLLVVEAVGVQLAAAPARAAALSPLLRMEAAAYAAALQSPAELAEAEPLQHLRLHQQSLPLLLLLLLSFPP
jgi:hypothetical protein